MASFSYDSELMIQHVAAIAVPDSSCFITVRDKHDSPMLFSLGSDKKLYLILNNQDGKRIIVDFSARLQLADGYDVYAFDVVQAADSTLFIILATQDSSTGRDLIVLRPFKPSDYDLADGAVRLWELKMPQTGTGTQTDVKAIYMSKPNGQHYPLVLFAFRPLGQINHTQDLARLMINPSFDGWSIKSDLSLPENAFKMVALHPLILPVKGGSLPGFITIYEIQKQLQLVFAATELSHGIYWKVSLQCPAGAETLSSFTNKNGFTDLLVGGQGLHHFQAAECLRNSAQGRKVTDHGVFSSVRQLYATQSNTQLSIWAANARNGIGYLNTDTALERTGSPVQVVPDSQGGRFSPFKSTPSSPEQFIVSNGKGVLSLLQQDSVLGFWKSVPFYTPALETTIKIPSYTTQITASDSNNMPVVGCEVLLKSSGLVSIIANGLQVLAGPVEVALKTDQYGLITLIIPTNDISSYIFEVSGAEGGELYGKSCVVDPMEKVNSILEKIHNGSDLTTVVLPSGRRLLEHTKLSAEEINQAAKAIEALQKARKSVVTVSGGAGQYSSHAPQVGSSVSSHSENISEGGNVITDMAWDAWHWLECLTTKIVAWSIEKFQQGTAFIVRLGENIYRWVLDGLTEVGKALSWVLDKVLEIGGEIIEWLGFIFNWKDIQATHRSIVHLTNDALTTGLVYMDTLEDKVDKFFDDITSQLRQSSDQILPEKLGRASASSQSANDLVANPNCAKANWAQYQFSHGGGVDSSIIHGEDGESGPLEVLWADVVLPLYETFKALVKDLADTICRIFFSEKKPLTVEEAMAELKTTVLVQFVIGIQKVAVGLLKVIKSVITDFKKYINNKVTIPVFSSLYKTFISGGAELTFLDGLAMILAIPITILTKIMTGKAPPDMMNVQYSRIINDEANKEQLLEFNHFNSVSSMVGFGLCGLISSISIMMDAKAEAIPDTNLGSNWGGGSTAASAGGSKIVSSGAWKDVLGVIAQIASIPTDSTQPALPLRWISWVLSCINMGLGIAMRRVTAASFIIERVLAVIESALATINYALIVGIKAIELQTSDFPGKNDDHTSLNIVCATLNLLSTLSSGVGQLALDPATKAWAAGSSQAAQGLSISIEGSVMMVNLRNGDYNDISTL